VVVFQPPDQSKRLSVAKESCSPFVFPSYAGNLETHQVKEIRCIVQFR